MINISLYVNIHLLYYLPSIKNINLKEGIMGQALDNSSTVDKVGFYKKN